MTTNEIKRAISIMFMLAHYPNMDQEAKLLIMDELKAISDDEVREHIISILSVHPWAL